MINKYKISIKIPRQKIVNYIYKIQNITKYINKIKNDLFE